MLLGGQKADRGCWNEANNVITTRFKPKREEHLSKNKGINKTSDFRRVKISLFSTLHASLSRFCHCKNVLKINHCYHLILSNLVKKISFNQYKSENLGGTRGEGGRRAIKVGFGEKQGYHRGDR